MVDDLHHGGEVALFLEFAGFDTDEVEEFVGINEVEIACQGQVAGGDRITFDKGMAELGEVPALGAIAKMAQEEFPQKGDMSFHESGMLGISG
jgi:hypothetical protein